VRRNAIAVDPRATPAPTSALAISVLEPVGAAAAGLGHLNVLPDADGAVRSEALALRHYDEAYPALSAMLVARSLNLGPKDMRVSADAVRIGELSAPTGDDARLQTGFHRYVADRAPFAQDSFYDVLNGRIQPEKYRDKIVLVGPPAAGVANLFVTPVNPGMPAVELEAQAVSSLLQENAFVIPPWARLAELSLLVVVALYLVIVLPWLRAGAALAATAAAVAALVAAHFVLMT
jgi:CHASE2 domain-containing sensor protein